MTFYDKVHHIEAEFWFTPLAQLFSKMDAAYDEVADAYGFHCRGCIDNCCYTRFHHHTLLEYLYLKKGMKNLDQSLQDKVFERAGDVVSKTRTAEEKGQIPRIMCPLNHDGLCLIYAYRPMICRLHGLSHELKKPGQNPLKSEGCDLFTELTETMDYIPFDRTPFYMEMARLEQNLRKVSGVTDRLKMTIAEMIRL